MLASVIEFDVPLREVFLLTSFRPAYNIVSESLLILCQYPEQFEPTLHRCNFLLPLLPTKDSSSTYRSHHLEQTNMLEGANYQE